MDNYKRQDVSYVKFRWHQQCLLLSLSGIMKDYGTCESSISFSTFNCNLMSVCNVAGQCYASAKDTFYENFVSSLMIHCLRQGMKEVCEAIMQLDAGICRFRLLYSPTVVHLLNALNVMWRSLCVQKELTDKLLMMERTGSMIGCLLMEHMNMLDTVDNIILEIRLNEHSQCNVEGLLGKATMQRDDHKLIARVQTKMYALQILFDVYKVVTVELHRKNKVTFFS